jgi:hypothetical protein
MFASKSSKHNHFEIRRCEGEFYLNFLQESGSDVNKKAKEDQSGSTKSDKKFTPLQDEEENSNVK